MADDGINTSIDNHKDGKEAQTILAEFIVNPDRDRISELTSLPLDQHRPHSLINMLSDILRHMCKEAVQRQKRMNIIYAQYHKDKNGEGIIPVDLDKDSAWNIEKLERTNLENWSYYFKQNRRGYKNELLMSATTLAQSQLESEQPATPEEILGRFVKSEG